MLMTDQLTIVKGPVRTPSLRTPDGSHLPVAIGVGFFLDLCILLFLLMFFFISCLGIPKACRRFAKLLGLCVCESEKAQTCRFCQHSRREKTKLCTFSSLSVIIYYVIMTLLLLFALWHWLIITLIVFCVFHRHRHTNTHTQALSLPL